MTQARQVAPDRADIELIRGDDLDILATIYDANGSTVDITGATATFTVKTQVDGTSIFSLSTSSGITLTTPGSGLMTISIATSNTSSQSPGKYYYDLQVTLASRVVTVLRGSFTIQGDVT